MSSLEGLPPRVFNMLTKAGITSYSSLEYNFDKNFINGLLVLPGCGKKSVQYISEFLGRENPLTPKVVKKDTVESLQQQNTALQQQVKDLQAENESSMSEASKLAMYLWKTHYCVESPVFELLEDASGVISQIDNMAAGLIRRESIAEIKAAAIREAIEFTAERGTMGVVCYKKDLQEYANTLSSKGGD